MTQVFLRCNLMSVDVKSNGSMRVLLLIAQADFVAISESDKSGLTLPATDNAYEAAAELLLAPVTAMILDLRLLHPRHAGLLKFTGQAHVPVYAFGHACSQIAREKLASIKLISQADLPAVLKQLSQNTLPAVDISDTVCNSVPGIALAQAIGGATVESPAIPLSQDITPLDESDELSDLFEQATEIMVPLTSGAAAQAQTPARRRQNPAETHRKWADKSLIAEGASHTPRPPSGSTNREGLLTPQELAALLEVKP